MAMYPNMMQSIPFKKHKKFQAGSQEKQTASNEKGEEKENNEQKMEENLTNVLASEPQQQEPKNGEQAK
jgi:hypothetical protein